MPLFGLFQKIEPRIYPEYTFLTMKSLLEALWTLQDTIPFDLDYDFRTKTIRITLVDTCATADTHDAG